MFWYTMTINLYVPAPSPLFVLLNEGALFVSNH